MQCGQQGEAIARRSKDQLLEVELPQKQALHNLNVSWSELLFFFFFPVLQFMRP